MGFLCPGHRFGRQEDFTDSLVFLLKAGNTHVPLYSQLLIVQTFVFNNKPFQGKAWYFCYLVFCLAPEVANLVDQWHGTDDSHRPSMPLITVHLEHKCGLKSSSPLAALDSRRNSHRGWKYEHTGLVCDMHLSVRSMLLQLEKFCFQHWCGS